MGFFGWRAKKVNLKIKELCLFLECMTAQLKKRPPTLVGVVHSRNYILFIELQMQIKRNYTCCHTVTTTSLTAQVDVMQVVDAVG